MAAMSAPHTSLRLRPMREADLPAVMRIERDAFPSVWPLVAYQQELRGNPAARYFVVEAGVTGATRPRARRWLAALWGRHHPAQPLVGFLGLWVRSEGCHIVTLAIDASRRRNGIGALLLVAAVELAAREECPIVTLECRVSAAPALSLYRGFGFAEVGRREGYYDDGEDAVSLALELTKGSPGWERFRARRAEHVRRFGRAIGVDRG